MCQDFTPSKTEKLLSEKDAKKVFSSREAFIKQHNKMVQLNGVAKRKRPAEAPVSWKKDASKKPADAVNKKAKTSIDDKSVPVKKPFSNVLPVAPLAISKLKGPWKEEAAFPRGGGSILTPLEYKEVTNQAVKDVLFETGAGGSSKSGGRGPDGDVDMDSEEKKPRHKKRKTEHSKKSITKVDTEKVENTGPKVEGLSFKVRGTQTVLWRHLLIL